MPPVPQCKYMLTKYQTDLSSVVAPSTSPDYAHLTTIPDPVPLQQLTAGFGKASCRALGLQSGTWQSRYTQLYVGFAVSGLLHCGGDLLVDPSHKLFGASFPFFFSQAVAITFEDAVIALVRRSGVKVPQVLARAVSPKASPRRRAPRQSVVFCPRSSSCAPRRLNALLRPSRVASAALPTRPQVRRDYPLSLSISISGGKETYKDSPSNGERTGNSPA